jgi:hypothetical protein
MVVLHDALHTDGKQQVPRGCGVLSSSVVTEILRSEECIS